MYRVEIESNPDFSFRVRSGGYEFNIDLNEKGITPPGALLASLGSCLGVYIRKYAQGAGITLDNFGIHVEAEFCKDFPSRFKVINVNIDLRGADLDERRRNAFLGFIKNCPVHNTLKNNPLVEIKII